MKDYVASRSPCPIGRASRLLGDRWVILILREAFLGVERFDGFMDRLTISRATLTTRLAWLVDADILARHPPDAKRSTYRLTASGQALGPVLEVMREWAEVWLPLVDGMTPAFGNQPATSPH